MYQVNLPGPIFNNFISSIYEVANECKITFSSSITVNAIDSSKALLINTSIQNPSPPEGDFDLIIDVKSLKEFITKSPIVTFKYDDTKNTAYVISGRTTYLVPIIVSNVLSKPIPDLVHPVVFDVFIEALDEGLKNQFSIIDSKDNQASIWFEYDDTFYMKDKSTLLCTVKYINVEDFTLIKKESNAKTLLSHDYLRSTLKILKPYDSIIVSLGSNYPVVFEASNQSQTIRLAIAPRLVEE